MRRVLAVIAPIVAALVLGAVVRSAAEELAAARHYAGGTRIESAAGVSFVVPAGWTGKAAQDATRQILVMGSTSMEGVGLAILSANQTAAEVIALLNETQDLGAGVKLAPTTRAVVQGSYIAGRYEDAARIGRSLALLGPQNNSVIFFFAGPKKHEAFYTQLLSDLGHSVAFGRPAEVAVSTPTPSGGARGGRWAELLSGQMLHYFSTYNSGGGSGGMAAHRVLHLCSDGLFAYFGDNSITMNVPGASGSSGGRSAFQGKWSIETATDASAVLILSGDDGRQLRWPVRYDGQKTFLNGQRWLRAASDRCR